MSRIKNEIFYIHKKGGFVAYDCLHFLCYLSRALDSDQDGFVSYGQFRNFAVLLPKHKLQESQEPSIAWFESATMVPLGELSDWDIDLCI